MDEFYVQSIGIKMVLPNGKTVLGKFMGMAMCSPEEWEEMKENNLWDHLAEGDCLIMQNPIPLEKAMAGQENYNDVIDIIREELRKDHHDNLKED